MFAGDILAAPAADHYDSAVRMLLVMALLAAGTGCASPPGGWDSPEPSSRLGAILDASKTRDRAAIPRLIESLSHDDPVVRLAAIHALEDLTGQTLGYDYAAPEWDRQEKVAAWAAWYKAQGPGTTAPARSGSAAGSPGGEPIQKVSR